MQDRHTKDPFQLEEFSSPEQHDLQTAGWEMGDYFRGSVDGAWR